MLHGLCPLQLRWLVVAFTALLPLFVRFAVVVNSPFLLPFVGYSHSIWLPVVVPLRVHYVRSTGYSFFPQHWLLTFRSLLPLRCYGCVPFVWFVTQRVVGWFPVVVVPAFYYRSGWFDSWPYRLIRWNASCWLRSRSALYVYTTVPLITRRCVDCCPPPRFDSWLPLLRYLLRFRCTLRSLLFAALPRAHWLIAYYPLPLRYHTFAAHVTWWTYVILDVACMICSCQTLFCVDVWLLPVLHHTTCAFHTTTHHVDDYLHTPVTALIVVGWRWFTRVVVVTLLPSRLRCRWNTFPVVYCYCCVGPRWRYWYPQHYCSPVRCCCCYCPSGTLLFFWRWCPTHTTRLLPFVTFNVVYVVVDSTLPSYTGVVTHFGYLTRSPRLRLPRYVTLHCPVYYALYVLTFTLPRYALVFAVIRCYSCLLLVLVRCYLLFALVIAALPRFRCRRLFPARCWPVCRYIAISALSPYVVGYLALLLLIARPHTCRLPVPTFTPVVVVFRCRCWFDVTTPFYGYCCTFTHILRIVHSVRLLYVTAPIAPLWFPTLLRCCSR